MTERPRPPRSGRSEPPRSSATGRSTTATAFSRQPSPPSLPGRSNGCLRSSLSRCWQARFSLPLPGAGRTGSAQARLWCRARSRRRRRLLLCALAPGRAGFAIGVLAMQLASCFVLYSTAFVAIVQLGGRDAQRSITHLTLIAGFASTLFWPLTTALHEHFDWREVLAIFAALNLGLCLPLHAWLARLTRRSAKDRRRTPRPSPPATFMLRTPRGRRLHPHARRLRDRGLRALGHSRAHGAADGGGRSGHRGRIRGEPVRAVAGRQPLHQHAVRPRRTANLAGARRDRGPRRRSRGAACSPRRQCRAPSSSRFCSAWDPGS